MSQTEREVLAALEFDARLYCDVPRCGNDATVMLSCRYCGMFMLVMCPDDATRARRQIRTWRQISQCPRCKTETAPGISPIRFEVLS